MIEHINWYPGHMKKTRELIQENLKMVDVVLEILDARIPLSSRNPIIDDIICEKTRMVILNKSDLSDERQNAAWQSYFSVGNTSAMRMNSMSGGGSKQLLKLLSEMQEVRDQDSLRKKNLRMMIVGVPNVGKSSLINRLTGKKSTRTGDRPGVTRGKQWLTLENGMQLLDTPGILWPKFEDPKAGLNLAFCGSIKDEILDTESLALELIKVLMQDYGELLAARYKLDEVSSDPEDGLEVMESIARKRGFILPGKKIDYERTARTVLDEFRGGLIGRITLERCQADSAESGAFISAEQGSDEQDSDKTGDDDE